MLTEIRANSGAAKAKAKATAKKKAEAKPKAPQAALPKVAPALPAPAPPAGQEARPYEPWVFSQQRIAFLQEHIEAQRAAGTTLTVVQQRSAAQAAWRASPAFQAAVATMPKGEAKRRKFV